MLRSEAQQQLDQLIDQQADMATFGDAFAVFRKFMEIECTDSQSLCFIEYIDETDENQQRYHSITFARELQLTDDPESDSIEQVALVCRASLEHSLPHASDSFEMDIPGDQTEPDFLETFAASPDYQALAPLPIYDIQTWQDEM